MGGGGVVYLRYVRRGTPSSTGPHHPKDGPDKQYSSMMFFNVPWTTMNINVSHLYYANAIYTIFVPWYIPSLFIVCLFVKAFKFNVSVVHLCQDCKKYPGENILQWFTRLDSNFTFDFVVKEAKLAWYFMYWKRWATDPGVYFPTCVKKCFYETHCFPEHPSLPLAGVVLLCSLSSCIWLWMDWKINQYQAKWPSQPWGYSAQLALHLNAGPLAVSNCHVLLCSCTWCCIYIQPYWMLRIIAFGISTWQSN